MYRIKPDERDPMLDFIKILVGVLLCLICLVLFIWHAIFAYELGKKARDVNSADMIKK